MPLSALYEDLFCREWSKSAPGMHRPRVYSPANRPLRSGRGSSSRSITPRSTASALPNTNAKVPAARETLADDPSGTTNAAEGAPEERQKRKPKKKGWKGWAMLYYDDDGNVIEKRLRDETPPDERSMTSPPPETMPSRVNIAAVSDMVPEKGPRTSLSPQRGEPTLPCSSSVVRLTEAAAEPTEPQKADYTAQPKKRRKTSPGSNGKSYFISSD